LDEQVRADCQVDENARLQRQFKPPPGLAPQFVLVGGPQQLVLLAWQMPWPSQAELVSVQ
jgi:hypothetical protein